MRQRLLNEFRAVWIDSLNGDSRETGKLTPEGLPDPSVFSTGLNREGIRVGTAIGLFLRGAAHAPGELAVRFRQFWGVGKRADLAARLNEPASDAGYVALRPDATNRYLLRPGEAAADYASWPALPDLARIPPLNGLMEKRGGALIDTDREALERRMRIYLELSQPMETVRASAPGLAEDRARFGAVSTRDSVARREGFVSEHLTRYHQRPFEICWDYATTVRPVWNEPRPKLQHTLPDAEGFLVLRPAAVADPEG